MNILTTIIFKFVSDNWDIWGWLCLASIVFFSLFVLSHDVPGNFKLYAGHCSWKIMQAVYIIFLQQGRSLYPLASRYCENHVNIIRAWADSRLRFSKALSAKFPLLGCVPPVVLTKSLGYLFKPLFLDKVQNSYYLFNLVLLRIWLCFSKPF